jgi:hypothetical protein
MTEISPTIPLPRGVSDPVPPPPPPPDMSLQLPGHEESFFGETPPIVKSQEKRWAMMDRLRRMHRQEKRREKRRERDRLDYLRKSYVTMAHVMIGIVANFNRDPVRRAERRAKLERRMGVAPGSGRITTSSWL